MSLVVDYMVILSWVVFTLVFGLPAVGFIIGWCERRWPKQPPMAPPLPLVNADALAKVREINCGQWSDGSYCDDSGACECREIAALFTATPPKLVECGLCGVMRQQGVKCSWG